MHLPKPSESGSYEPCPAGTYTAICYRFVDRGTQINEFNGERKTRREVMLTWEIPDELMADGRPFSISKTYTFSTHEKATFRKDLESWRGRAFIDDDFDGPNAFDTRNLLGKLCTLTVTHDVKGDKIYSKVAAVGKAMKGVSPPALVNPIAYFALTPDRYDASIYGALSDKLKEIISRSPEYQEILRNSHRSDDPGQTPRNLDDEIPF